MTYKEQTRELVSEDAFKNLCIYVEMIEEKNKVMNLTGFKGDRLWEEGIYESIFLLKEFFGEPIGKEILDIGAGAGFPSVPFLIAYPQNKLTIYEPTKKRTIFLNEVRNRIGLIMDIKNIRSEDSNQEEIFDYITARAVMHFKPLCEVSHKPAKIGAKFAFLKGPKAKDELHEARFIKKTLDIEPEIIEISTRTRSNFIITYLKNGKTKEKYPRKWIDIIK